MTCAKKLEVSVATPALFCLFPDQIWPLQNRKLLSQTTILTWKNVLYNRWTTHLIMAMGVNYLSGLDK